MSIPTYAVIVCTLIHRSIDIDAGRRSFRFVECVTFPYRVYLTVPGRWLLHCTADIAGIRSVDLSVHWLSVVVCVCFELFTFVRPPGLVLFPTPLPLYLLSSCLVCVPHR